MHKELVFSLQVYTENFYRHGENLSYNILSHNSEVGEVPGFSYLYPAMQNIGPVTKVIR